MSTDKLKPIKDNLNKIWQGTTGRFTEYLAYEALEGAVLGIFDCFSLQDILNAITENTAVWDLPWGDFETFRFQLQMLSRDERFSRNAHLLTAENVLIWLSDDKTRPGIASLIINTPGGPAWLTRQVESLKTGALSPIEVESVE